MEELNSNPTAPEESQEETLGRRELLKALAATGGAVAAGTLLPSKWTKPVIEVGVLPAHAQVSALTISNLVVEGPLLNDVGSAGLGGLTVQQVEGEIWNYLASFDYNDPLGLVDKATILFGTWKYSPSGTVVDDSATFEVLISSGATWTGNGFSGTLADVVFVVFYGFLDGLDTSNDTSVEVTFWIQTTDGRTSNTLSAVLERPFLE